MCSLPVGLSPVKILFFSIKILLLSVWGQVSRRHLVGEGTGLLSIFYSYFVDILSISYRYFVGKGTDLSPGRHLVARRPVPKTTKKAANKFATFK